MNRLIIFTVFLLSLYNVFAADGTNTKQKTIYLTIDDGPSGALTKQFLELFDQYNVKATFYHMGKKAELQIALCKKVLSKGHQVGNHGLTHKDLTELSEADVREELITFQNLYKQQLNYEPSTFRAPFLKSNIFIDELVDSLGMTSYKINAYARDAKPEVEVEMIVDNLSDLHGDKLVILCHERTHTLEALKHLIPIWKGMGYSFEALRADG
ncbi:polysaccharide deacetylase family protein [Carboxylicivirga marina]|uniref:Polysaccharide deacetylase family protein n=1 Tax=Carboxylicivirga marina TaxID=2800988 RepID=A0ABS1HKL8_9BACT|nr:polysaccharide deacetylase family protein [Carboxylicivirga marina]MBK3518217.1 polysaccharide deacetylase family protein [Carboxylicivirga marina]